MSWASGGRARLGVALLGLWIVFACLTGVAVFSVLWPLSRTPKVVERRELDVAFYHAQTAEIEREAARGAIAADEAEIAKAEAARRLMGAAAHGDPPVAGSQRAVRLVAVASLAFVPLLALTLYGRIGRPGMPDQPLEARLAVTPAAMDLPTAVAKIERHLAASPGDGRGYDILAPIYLRMGRAEDAAGAYGRAIALLGPSAERYAGLGEAQIFQAGGVVTAAARQSLEQSVALDAAAPRAAYYLGLAAQQDGDKEKALAIWRKLAADAPRDAPWRGAVEARIAEASGASAAPAEAGAQAQDKVAAVAALPDDKRQAMIRTMVDGLAQRLAADGGDVDGWLRLVRAYRVLDERDKARDALARARRTFAADDAATQRLDALARELGLEG